MAYVKDSDGHWHTIIDQTKGSSCGPACVRMIAKIKGKDVGEEQVRQMIERSEGGSVSTLTSETSSYGAGSHDWGKQGHHGSAGGGTGTWNVGEGLKALKISVVDLKGDAAAALNRTTKTNPGIAVVKWSTGGLHWVVVAGKLKNGNVLILDPACGIKEANPKDPSPHYFDKNGVKGTFTGQMTVCAQ